MSTLLGNKPPSLRAAGRAETLEYRAQGGGVTPDQPCPSGSAKPCCCFLLDPPAAGDPTWPAGVHYFPTDPSVRRNAAAQAPCPESHAASRMRPLSPLNGPKVVTSILRPGSPGGRAAGMHRG